MNSPDNHARSLFGASVQNSAFVLVLSKQMIEGLKTVRDYKNCGFSPWMNPLVRRGLVIIDDSCAETYNFARLSGPGERVCELLAEAGMIPAKTVEHSMLEAA